jgi:hypothetical protein
MTKALPLTKVLLQVGLDGREISSIANTGCGSGWTSNFQLWLLTSSNQFLLTKKFWNSNNNQERTFWLEAGV